MTEEASDGPEQAESPEEVWNPSNPVYYLTVFLVGFAIGVFWEFIFKFFLGL